MNRYQNIDCPICKQSLGNGDNVVVCPECGAPYHLDCYKTNGKCIFDELHAKGESWQPPKPKEDEKTIDGKASLRCSRCGTVNPATGLFCHVCGNELSENENQNFKEQPVPPMGMPFNPFTTPFGGVDPEETIDSVPAKEVAAFVGKNSHYYLPKFSQLSKTNGRGKIINWAGFFFTGWYFIYRKMYAIGILGILIDFVLGIPYLLMIYSQMNTVSSLAAPEIDINLITTLNMVSNLIVMFFRFCCGFFANTLYKRFTLKKINQIKLTTQGQGSEAYMGTLSKKGNVAIKLIFSILVAYTILYFVSLFMLMFSM